MIEELKYKNQNEPERKATGTSKRDWMIDDLWQLFLTVDGMISTDIERLVLGLDYI